jgi:PPK2 family polyphosphate:nucleotide phosphotransferase
VPDRIQREARRIAARYRIDHPGNFRLRDCDPRDTGTIDSKEDATRMLQAGVERLAGLQEKLYAQDRWSLLLVFQAMDAAGKDGTIKHVMSGVNPQGCQVFSFKAPSNEELDHDFLWRCNRNLPERGRIGIFNRSYYEEVLVVRVHPEILANQNLPVPLVTKDLWKQRYEDINAFEQHLVRNGTVIRKFFLNISREEQRDRFLDRLREPDKHWKFSKADVQEREHWDDYMRAYEDTIRATSTRYAPWYVVPADRKWFTRLTVAAAIVETLEELDLRFPTTSPAKRRELAQARDVLEREVSKRPRARQRTVRRGSRRTTA